MKIGIRSQTAILLLAALAVRLVIIFPGPLESKVEFLMNRADLRNYYWPAQAALHGDNPYLLWSTGQSGEFRSDMAPLELVVYVATVAVWNDPRAIQLLFALFDVVNVALLGLLLRHSSLRLPFQMFYALGPLTLYNLVFVPEDKSIVLTLTFLLFYFLSLGAGPRWAFGRRRLTGGDVAVVVAALMASFKWLSIFYLLPLLLFVSRDARMFVRQGMTFALILVIAHLPWLPTWWTVYAFRSARTATPFHISPAVLLNSVGLFDRSLLVVLLVGTLGVIYLAFWKKRLDIFETISLATAVGILWTPDMDPVHLTLASIGMLLVVDWTRGKRQFIVWSASLWVAAVYEVSTHSGYARLGLQDLRLFTGEYGSVQMILLSYLLFAFLIIWYMSDKIRGCAVGASLLANSRVPANDSTKFDTELAQAQ